MKTIDELNSITTEYEEVDIDTYFEPMDITEEQKEERKKAAEDLWWVLLLMFGLIKQSIEDGDLDYAFMYDTFKESYADVVEKYSRIDDYTTTYIDKFVQNTLDTTWNHIDFENPDSYWTSNKRALGIAVNEANTILNYEDLQRAIDNGMNVKIWHTQKDNRVRPDHRRLEGRKIGITAYFQVGDSQLLFPRDEVNCINIKDIANCRCYAKADYDPKYEKRFEDITSIFPRQRGHKEVVFDNSYTDKAGNTYYVDGKNVVREEGVDEINTANIIVNNLGGEIHLVPKVYYPQRKRTPDYIYLDEKWDRKGLNGDSDNMLYNATHKNKEQSNNFVFVIQKTHLPVDEIINQAEGLYYSKHTAFIDKVMIIEGEKIIKILKRKHLPPPK